jgi:23S rRNA (cytidine1920-2'-O)/16S rRNA (cytidine1409-2'-O)-methyltransferase
VKERLDALLLRRGLADSRTRAQALIREGLVLVGGEITDKPGALVSTDAEVELRAGRRYASRGAGKLLSALDAFCVDPLGRACLDVGASTGGFTDVLLERGARVVYAVDVGRGQLAWRLRRDSRVVNLERHDIRSIASLPEPIEIATVDVSFISLRLVMPAVAALLSPAGRALCLVKPQFEAGRGEVGRGGVIRNPDVQRTAILAVAADLTRRCWSVLDAAASAVPGSSGNREFWLLLSSAPSDEGHSLSDEQIVDKTVGQLADGHSA